MQQSAPACTRNDAKAANRRAFPAENIAMHGGQALPPMTALCWRPKIAAVLLAAGLLVASSLCTVAGQPAPQVARAHTWAFFNIQRFSFFGYWNNQTYHADVWLRNICHNSITNTLRMTVFIHEAPYIATSPGGVHSITPAGFLDDNGTLPDIWFESDNRAVSVTATTLTKYDQLIRLQQDATALVLAAELPADVPFTVRMEGSERVHQLPRHCSPKQHPLFADRSVWLGIVDGTTIANTTAQHSRLMFNVPSPRSGDNSTDSSETADDHSISSEVMSELAALLGALEASSSPASTVADNTDSSTGSDSTSTDINSTALNSNIAVIVAELEKLQQLQQRKMLASSSRDMYGTMLTSRHTKVLASGVSDRSFGVNSTSSIRSSSSTATKGQSIAVQQTGGNMDGSVSSSHAKIDAAQAAVVAAVHAEAGHTSPIAMPSLGSQSATMQNAATSGTTSSVTDDSFSGSTGSPAAFRFGLAPAMDDPPADVAGTKHRRSSYYRNSSNSWNRSAAVVDFDRKGAIKRFLALQHLAHHRALGFSGSIMVVMPHTAEQLLQSRALRRAVQRQRLVLILWDEGLEPRASHFMQVPAYNLLRLAAWGSDVALGFWDLDEYLVLPNHKGVSHEVFDGCLSHTLALQPEAVIHSVWARSQSWNSSAELVGWMQYGHWSTALQSMHYAMWPYTFCDGACKSIVKPNSDLLFQVHQHARPPPKSALEPHDWRCGYILHFYRLWSERVPLLMQHMGYSADAGGIPGIPYLELIADVVPKSQIERLARTAKVYADMVSSNPSLKPPS